jgi:hypothetical protein
VSYKLAPGGAPYELQVGCHPILPYLLSLGKQDDDSSQQMQLATAFERIQAHERLLSERLLAYLLSDEANAKGVRIVGPQTSQDRVPTISFVVVEQASKHGAQVTYKKTIASKDIVSRFDRGQKVSCYPVSGSIPNIERSILRSASSMVTFIPPKSCLVCHWTRALLRTIWFSTRVTLGSHLRKRTESCGLVSFITIPSRR